VIVTDGLEMTLEVEDHGLVEAISALGSVKGNRRDRTVTTYEEVF
jgi:hypothetical protein